MIFGLGGGVLHDCNYVTFLSSAITNTSPDTVTAILIKWPSLYLSYIYKLDNSQMLAFSLSGFNFMCKDLERSKYSVFTRQWHTFEDILIN